jgi:hypothetical protein
MLLGIGIVGFVACMVSWGVIMPASKLLILKLGTLSDMTRRAQPELYRERIAAIDPHNGPKFVHNRIARMLRADLSAFGDICQRLQHEARNLDRKVHLGLIPAGLYFTGLAIWYFVARGK